MVFDYRNNVIVNLASAVLAGVTTIAVDPAKQDLIPNGVQNTIATLEEIDANGVITLRECILITNRAGGALTVVRADQAVPASDAATTHTQISYPFDPSNGARIGIYVTRKSFETIEADILALQAAQADDYVTEVALINNDHLYSTSTTGTDAYEILIDAQSSVPAPVFTGYIDGQRFFVDFDVANSGSATLAVDNGTTLFPAKPLTKFNGQSLASGEITAGLKTIVMYDLPNDEFRIVGTLGDYTTSVVLSNLKEDFVLGEDFPSSDPRQGAGFIGKGQTQIQSLSTNGVQFFGDVAARTKVRLKLASTVNTSSYHLFSFSFWIDEVASPVDDIEFQLFEGTTPVASDLALTQTTIDGTQQIIVTGRAWFASNLSDKFVEIRRTGALNATDYYSIQIDSVGSLAGVSYEIFNGTVWSAGGGLLRFTTTFGFEKDKIYLTDPRGLEAEDMRAKAVTTGLEGETKSFYIGGTLDHIASTVDREYQEHILVDKLVDDLLETTIGTTTPGLTLLLQGGLVGGNERVGQTYTMTDDYLYKFSARIRKTLVPTDFLIAKVYDSPGGPLLATSVNMISGASLATVGAGTWALSVFEFPSVLLGTGNQIYVEIQRTGARDVVNYYQVGRNGSIYAGGNAYTMTAGVPVSIPAQDISFVAGEGSNYVYGTGLYDINQFDTGIQIGTGFYVGNQISNGLFSLEIQEEQHEKQIKQVDVQIGSVAFGFGGGSVTIPHTLGIIPRIIELVVTPPNLQSGTASSGVSSGIWTKDGQSCVYSFGDGSTGIQYESGNRGNRVGVIHRSRTTAVVELEIINVDRYNVFISGILEGFYQLKLYR